MQRGNFTEKDLFNEEAMLEALSGDRSAVKAYLSTKTKDAATYLEEMRRAIDQDDFQGVIFQATRIHRVAYGMRSEALMDASLNVVVVAVKHNVKRINTLAKEIEEMLARVNAYLFAKGWLES